VFVRSVSVGVAHTSLAGEVTIDSFGIGYAYSIVFICIFMGLLKRQIVIHQGIIFSI
jgi:hypothetical protein